LSRRRKERGEKKGKVFNIIGKDKTRRKIGESLREKRYLRIKASKDEKVVRTSTEMEFLDISLTKDSCLWLYAIHSPFYWRMLKKTLV
jgi:hypothetical protein